MNIKRYIGKTNYEAMTKLKSELGNDAVILHTRRIKSKGILGFFKKPLIEIVAAKEENVDFKKEIKKKQSYNNEISKLNIEISKLRETVENNLVLSNENKNTNNGELEYVKKILTNNGVLEQYAIKILEDISNNFNLKNKSKKEIIDILKKNIKVILGEPKPIEIENKSKVFFVGTTGVGKTTTLAKIAADLSLNKNKSIGLVTSDTYRIAAVEQLKVYSEILNLPLEIIYNPEDIYDSMSRFKDKDIILVDTAGRSHKDNEKISELEGMIDTVNNKETFLVLSVNTEFNSLKAIIDKYSKIDNIKIIFTKLDETEKIGNILNIRLYTKYPISYLTTGQNVPEDIQTFNNEDITNMIVGEN
ncbi:flagellar biosynthesis protein FlhF [Senegalia massiliensis]|uniref:Flagellar biosynthesis protein FlhF n=1 Tax=Senegalia massiliensis TaxID=1720316 RepID=A0A845R2E7_9CLOT|nr:flagellar biosynthesis protein FlhF [Senegalia massiliensis]NBI07876.1 flagellar biosynthesis protein FlhF [Senegalia massiliensis]